MARRKKNGNGDSADIAKLAYEKYAKRGYVDGFDLQDWFEAELELKAQSSPAIVSFEVQSQGQENQAEQ